MNSYTRLYDRHGEASYLLRVFRIAIRNALEVLHTSVWGSSCKANGAYLIFREQCIADACQQHHAYQEGYRDSVRHGWLRVEEKRVRKLAATYIQLQNGRCEVVYCDKKQEARGEWRKPVSCTDQVVELEDNVMLTIICCSSLLTGAKSASPRSYGESKRRLAEAPIPR